MSGGGEWREFGEEEEEVVVAAGGVAVAREHLGMGELCHCHQRRGAFKGEMESAFVRRTRTREA